VRPVERRRKDVTVIDTVKDGGAGEDAGVEGRGGRFEGAQPDFDGESGNGGKWEYE